MAVDVDWLMTRLCRLEDIVAVHETLAAYGLTVDGGATDVGGRLWTEDCVYDSDGGGGGYRTRAEIEAFIESTRRAKIGFAHLTHVPMVVVDGDVATAYGASSMPMASDTGDFQVSRVSVNKWTLVRAGDTWQVERRTSRKLNGLPESRALLAEGARPAVTEREARGGTREPTQEGHDVDADARLIEMERRIGELEDKLAILQVVAGHGPSVDGGAVEETGSVQVSHMPIIKVDGDRATVVNHSNTFDQDGDGFRIGRVSSNRWDLVRVDGTWQVERRVNHLLDGSRESKDVLGDGSREILGG